jgi:hypothetical protein
MVVFINLQTQSEDPLCRLVAGTINVETESCYFVSDGHTLHLLRKDQYRRVRADEAIVELEKLQLHNQLEFAKEMDKDAEDGEEELLV